MTWIPQISTVWVVQRISTGKVINVCRRMYVAKQIVSKDSSLKYTRVDLIG